jgi:predicted Zn-dependent protease
VKKELEKQFAEAVKIEKAGLNQAAKKLLQKLAKKDPRSIRILAALCLVCWNLKALKEAVKVSKRMIKLAPTLEAASKGLFHSLWELGKYVEALEEIKRFQSISFSKDYEEIVREINEKW